MSSINQKVVSPPPRTHEGTIAARITPEQELRRTLMACLLWEDTFYEDGEDVAARLTRLAATVPAPLVYALTLEARTQMKLRHAPLLVARAVAARKPVPPDLDLLLEQLIQRPDELTEFLAIYWKDGRQPLANAVKRGLAWALRKFDAYRLAKYNRAGAVTLRDVLFLTHAKPKTVSLGRWTKAERKGTKPAHPARAETPDEQLFRQLVDGTLPTPDTWEVALSGGKDKRETWERLIFEGKLGALALLRNLRNMREAQVPEATVVAALEAAHWDRVLPFRFVAAAVHAPQLEPALERAMFTACAGLPKLAGKTALLVDHSGSMIGTKVSAKSEMDRFDAAVALAILARELCESCLVIEFGTAPTIMPPRRGFALRDAIRAGAGGGTNTEFAKQCADREGYDRIVIITDEQSHQAITPPRAGTPGYVVNVGTYQHGIGYGPWTHIDGWSEAVLSYIAAAEGKPVGEPVVEEQ